MKNGPKLPTRLGEEPYFGSVALVTCILLADSVPLAPIVALPLEGAIGGGGLAWHAFGRRTAPNAALGFALGFAMACFLVFFSLISLQREADPAVGAIIWGFGMALGGGIGGSYLRRVTGPGNIKGVSSALAGLLAFGLAGALGGGLGFSLFRTMRVQGLSIGMILSLTLGGALLAMTLVPLEGLTPLEPGDSG